MAWLPPDRYPVWKVLLRDGIVDLATAAGVGDVLGRIHAATADRPDIAQAFPTDDLFHAIRLEPYLEATARVHVDLADRLAALVATTASTRRVLVHGDFSPKNLLVGPDGPVVLDAECAWFGDPAFDLAFVLNHLLLKGVWRPAARGRYLRLFAKILLALAALREKQTGLAHTQLADLVAEFPRNPVFASELAKLKASPAAAIPPWD